MKLPSSVKEAFRLNRRAAELWTFALDSKKARKFLLEKRQISEKTVRTFNLLYCPSENVLLESFEDNEIEIAKTLGLIKENEEGELRDTFTDCIIFPFCLPFIDGIQGFGFRRSGQKRYLNSKRSVTFVKDWAFYGVKQAIPKILETDWIILVEGYFDVHRINELGFENVLGTCGTAVSELKLSTIRRFANNFLLLFDPDDGGNSAKSRAKKILKKMNARVVSISLPKSEDPDSFGLKSPEKLCSKLNEVMRLNG